LFESTPSDLKGKKRDSEEQLEGSPGKKTKTKNVTVKKNLKVRPRKSPRQKA